MIKNVKCPNEKGKQPLKRLDAFYKPKATTPCSLKLFFKTGLTLTIYMCAFLYYTFMKISDRDI